MITSPNIRKCVVAICGSMLGGCGGSSSTSGVSSPTGSSTAPQANLSSAPGASAVNLYMQSPSVTQQSGTQNGDTYTLTTTISPIAGTTVYNGLNVHSATHTMAITKNGTPFETIANTSYYQTDPYLPLAYVSSGGTPYAFQSSYVGVPATFEPGQIGIYATYTIYHDSTLASIDAVETDYWSVYPSTPTALQFCLESENNNITLQGYQDGLVFTQTNQCFTENASGQVTPVMTAISSGNTTLVFQ